MHKGGCIQGVARISSELVRPDLRPGREVFAVVLPPGPGRILTRRGKNLKSESEVIE